MNRIKHSWNWFCGLGQNNGPVRRNIRSFWRVRKQDAQAAHALKDSGVDAVCSRFCGSESCQCGSTVRGLHCIWSYYRAE